MSVLEKLKEGQKALEYAIEHKDIDKAYQALIYSAPAINRLIAALELVEAKARIDEQASEYFEVDLDVAQKAFAREVLAVVNSAGAK